MIMLKKFVLNLNHSRCAVFFLAVTSLFVSMTVPANSNIVIEITGGAESGIPIAIVPFEFKGLGVNADQPSEVISSNLNLSGRFDVIAKESFLNQPSELAAVNYKDWRLIKAEYMVVGQVIDRGGNQFEIQYRLLDVFKEQQLLGRKYVVPGNLVRKVAHQISDQIYEELIGKPGAFDTKLAYVLVQGQAPNRKFLLQVSDSDGQNAQTVLTSAQPILSPSWSPDGTKLAYVSFEARRSIVIVQDIKQGGRERVAEFQGINSAPAWSPDGSRLALTLSKDGNTEIYVYGIANKQLQRITRHSAVDTEPAWMPDGRTLVFTSGRAGNPQLYKVNINGGTPERLTFNGRYNAGAEVSPDGNYIVLITDQGNGYQVGLYSMQDRNVRVLTSTTADDSPSFAPNGDMIIYATKRAGRDVMAAVSVDGQVQQTIDTKGGSVREPAWSPYNRKLL